MGGAAAAGGSGGPGGWQAGSGGAGAGRLGGAVGLCDNTVVVASHIAQAARGATALNTSAAKAAEALLDSPTHLLPPMAKLSARYLEALVLRGSSD